MFKKKSVCFEGKSWENVSPIIGIAPQVVMKFTGHADCKSKKPYIDFTEKAKTDAMDAMEKALNG